MNTQRTPGTRARTTVVATACAGVVALVASLLVAVAPAAAQTDPGASTDPGEAGSRRRAVQAQRATVSLEVDALQADDAQVQRALRELDANVSSQRDLLASAERRAAVAGERAQAAAAGVAEREAEVAEMRDRLAVVAVDSYVNPPAGAMLDRLQAANATEAAKKQAFLDLGSTSAADAIDQWRAAQHRLELDRARAERDRLEAERQHRASTRQLADLTVAYDQQQRFAAELGERLSIKLAEVEALKAVDAELAAELEAQQAVLAQQLRQLAEAPPPPPPTPAPAPQPPVGEPSAPPAPGPTPPAPGTTNPPVTAPPPTSPAPTSPPPTSPPPTSPPPTSPPQLPNVPTTVVRGIRVHVSIADQLEALLAAAEADGLRLTGSGYRDSANQIQLRRAHCGSSHYAIWEMPAWQCSPPTAIPGQSMHERGLAVDFANCSTRSTACYQWLAANAAAYGLYNLPSEPWHWSTNGR